MGARGLASAQEAPETIALDSGAVIALSRNDRGMRALLREARTDGALVIVPAPVLAEVLRGSRRDAAVHRILKAIDIERPMSASASRLAGKLLGRHQLSAKHTLDALIVATAIEHGASTIVTQDEADLTALAPADLAVIPC